MRCSKIRCGCLWGTCIVTAKGTVFNEDLHSSLVWKQGRYAVITKVNEKQGGTTVSKVTGASNAFPEKPMRCLFGTWSASLVGPTTRWGNGCRCVRNDPSRVWGPHREYQSEIIMNRLSSAYLGQLGLF